MTRTEKVTEYFYKFADRVGVTVILIDPDWLDHQEKHPTTAPFGWTPPFKDQGEFFFIVCSDRIDAQTQHLTDEELLNYLMAIDFLASLHIVHHKKPLEERVNLVEDILYNTADASLSLLSRVQLEALESTKS